VSFCSPALPLAAVRSRILDTLARLASPLNRYRLGSSIAADVKQRFVHCTAAL